MKYCEDVDCPNLGGEIGDKTDCRLGFENRFRTPRNMGEAVRGDCVGHIMPKACRIKYRKAKKEVADIPERVSEGK